MLKNNFFSHEFRLKTECTTDPPHQEPQPVSPRFLSLLRSSQATLLLKNDHPQLLGYITASHFTRFAVYCFTNVNILASSHSILFAVLLFFLKHFSKTPPWFARFNTLKGIQN